MKEGNVTITLEEYLKLQKNLKKLESSYKDQYPFIVYESWSHERMCSRNSYYNVSHEEINQKLSESNIHLKDVNSKLINEIDKFKAMTWLQFKKWKRSK